MSSAVGPFGPRHVHSGKHGGTPRRKAASSSEKTAEAPAGKLFKLTLDGDTARVVKLELLDESGTPRELSPDERSQILGESAESTLDVLLTRAFEAGIQIALDDTLAGMADSDDAEESDVSEDDTLRELLLKRLIERSSMKELLDHEVLTRAIVRTLIQQSTNETAAKNGPTQRATADRTTHPRTHRH